MRRSLVLFSLLAVAALAPVPAHAAGEIVVQVSGNGIADVTFAEPFLPDTSLAKVVGELGRKGTYAGFVAEPVGGDAALHSFAMVSVRWPSGAVTTIRQNRAADASNAAAYTSLTGTTPLAEAGPAPAGRWRFHFFGDTTTSIRVPAEGLSRSVTVKPARHGPPRAVARMVSMSTPFGQGRIPVTVSGRAAVIGAVMLHSDRGSNVASVCVARGGEPCADRQGMYFVPDLSEWWETVEVLAPPGTLAAGGYDVVHAAGGTATYDSHAIAVVVPTP